MRERGPPSDNAGPLGRLLLAADRVVVSMAYVSGAMFLLLSFYITFDVVGRAYGGPYSGFTDDIAAYVLAVAGTWALAFALRDGAHVRIDILMPLMPPRLARALELLAVVVTGIFAALLAIYAWRLAAGSYAINARSITPLQAPLVVPQSLMALGLTMLAVEAALLAPFVARRIFADGGPSAGGG